MIAAIDMPLTRRLFPLALAVVVALVTIEMIRRRKLREEYAIVWLLASAVLLTFAIFPGLVSWLSRTLQVNYLTIIVLACFFFLALIVMHLAVAISRQAEQIRQLAERMALLDRRLADRARSAPGAEAADGDEARGSGQPDVPAASPGVQGSRRAPEEDPPADTGIINKTIDFEDLRSDEAAAIVGEVNDLIRLLRDRKLKTSSWYGRMDLGLMDWKQKIASFPAGRSIEQINRGYGYDDRGISVDDTNFPWYLFWEIVWLTLHSGFRKGTRVLDLGGSSSLFSYYLASKGMDVTTVDLQKDLVANANHVAGQLGWTLKNYAMDIRDLALDGRFDHITSVSVYEHIPLFDRVAINERIGELLAPGGRFSITFDYRNPNRAARIQTPQDVHEQFVAPSDLKVRGNQEFHDSGTNYLLAPFYYRRRLYPFKLYSVLKGHFGIGEFFRVKDANDYTFGALFLEKG